MKINDLVKQYPELAIFAKRAGSHELYPPQEEAMKSGFLKGKNLVVASPTSSGKTRIAETAMMVNKSRGGKSLYLVPLRSLAREKYEDFKELYDGLQTVGLSIGDLTKSDERLGRNDLIVCSYEKFDSLLRHRASWIKDVSLVVLDEVHLIDDPYRGPTIEVLLTRLMQMGVWIVVLSATIGNPEELSDWLKALLVKSDFRPVKLLQGVLDNEVVKFKNDELTREAKDLNDLVQRVINENRQSLVFVNSRRSAEAVAERLSKELELQDQELQELSDKVLNCLPSPTSQCHRLAECVKRGVAFNHAGLVSSQKKLIESAFRQGVIKAISCTTVLAYGVSLPAYMVILRDLKRYTSEGMKFIPVSEYLQVIGRAGRSGYDSQGESVVIAKSGDERDKAWSEFLCAPPTELVSKLGAEPILRFHSLSLVCDGTTNSVGTLVEFFNKTFFGHGYGSESFLKQRVKTVTDDLVEWGFVKELNGKLVPTPMGLRINELYIDPLSAYRIIQGLKDPVLNPLGIIHLACSCGEIRPLRLGRNDYAYLLEELAINEDRLLVPTPNPFDYEYDGFIRAFKTALLFGEWINECGEDYLMKEYNVPPGVMHQLSHNLEWVLYAIAEIAYLQGHPGIKDYVNGLITRVRYGVKSELLTLVNLKGVGRVRARKLYANGLKSVKDILESTDRVNRLLGSGVTKNLLSYLQDRLE